MLIRDYKIFIHSVLFFPAHMADNVRPSPSALMALLALMYVRLAEVTDGTKGLEIF